MGDKNIRRAKDGFTLAEAVISVGVLIMALALFLSSFTKARQSAQLADDRIKAVHFARQNMEMLLTNTYTSAALSIANRPNWVTNISVSEGVTTKYYCSYAVGASSYSKARMIYLTNRWLNVVAQRTNEVRLATAVCSGFQY